MSQIGLSCIYSGGHNILEIKMKYVILYKRGTGNFSRLNPLDHMKLVDHSEVRSAMTIMEGHSFIEGVCVRLDDELFNIMATKQEDADTFILEKMFA